jgi:NhaP-type Na+/H+ or K+/H+ antiporter
LIGRSPRKGLRVGDAVLGPRERAATAFFGVRGVGSIYYLAYAAGEAPELGQDWLWSTVAFTIVASVLVHGVLSTPVMARLDPDPEPHPEGRE